MSHHLQNTHEALAVISTAIGATIAAATALLGQVPGSAFNGPAILDDEHYRLICIVGALGGAVVNLWIFPSAQIGISPMARKVSCSAITGVVCTPVAVHWFGIVPNIDNLLAASFFMAIVSVGLVQKAVPIWTRFLGAKLGVNGSGGNAALDSSPAELPATTSTEATATKPKL